MAKDGDLKSQLGAFMRSAVKGLDQVREVVVSKSKAGKIQLDVAMLRRKRKDILAELGAAVASLAAAGKINEEDFPELSSPLSALEALDERIAAEEERGRQVGQPAAAGGEDADVDEADDGLDTGGHSG